MNQITISLANDTSCYFLQSREAQYTVTFMEGVRFNDYLDGNYGQQYVDDNQYIIITINTIITMFILAFPFTLIKILMQTDLNFEFRCQ